MPRQNPYAGTRACEELLKAVGCPMDCTDSFCELVIESFAGLERTRIFELCDGRTGYVIDVRISNKLGRTIYKPIFDLALPWTDGQFRWVEKALHPKLNIYGYFFSSELTLCYDEQELLLNQRSGRGKLAHGDCMEGLLLGEGREPIPERYRQGGLVHAVFSVVDAIGNTWESPVDLYVDRSNQSQNKFSAKARSKMRYVESRFLGARLNGLDREYPRQGHPIVRVPT